MVNSRHLEKKRETTGCQLEAPDYVLHLISPHFTPSVAAE